MDIFKKIFLLVAVSILFISENSMAEITAKSFLVTGINGEIITQQDANDMRPIASITKLMTSMVVLDRDMDLDEMVPINPKNRGKYSSHLGRKVKSLSRRDLLSLALVKSDNLAAYTLCESYPGGVSECVYNMNSKALYLGLYNTHFVDPTGLMEDNVSTASDLTKLVINAQDYYIITNAGRTRKVEIRGHTFNNTNPIVSSDKVIVSKTGYIRASGGCLVMLLNTDSGPRIVVILGSKSVKSRFKEALMIAQL